MRSSQPSPMAISQLMCYSGAKGAPRGILKLGVEGTNKSYTLAILVGMPRGMSKPVNHDELRTRSGLSSKSSRFPILQTH